MSPIAILTGSLSRHSGGLYYSVRRLSQSLQLLGSSVHVIGTEDDAWATDREQWFPLEPTACKVVGPRGLGYSPQYARQLHSVQPSLTHLQYLWQAASWMQYRYSRRHQRPYVISPRGMLDSWALSHHRARKRWMLAAFQRRHILAADCMHALCQSEADSIRQFGYRGAIAVIPNGVDLPSIDPEATTQPTILFLSRLHEKKGVGPLLQGWQRIDKETRHGWRLQLAGWGEPRYLEQLRQLASSLRIEAEVDFLGTIVGTAKHKALTDCSAFVLPSFSEGLPIAALEAFAYGKPALLTDACNLPEAFEQGAAIRIESNPDSIAAGIEQLIQRSDAARRAIGDRGRRLAESHFQWPRIAQRFQLLYQSLLEVRGESKSPLLSR
jgi:glycosyltransferase involved in cell wall biosynthesis